MPSGKLPETASGTPLELAFDDYDPQDERRRESLFLLGNGVISSRCRAPEAESGDHHYPGTYRAGCYDRLSGQVEGERVEIESLVNLPDWLPLAFRAADEEDWISTETAEVTAYRHVLDIGHGVVRRSVTFQDGRGRRTRLEETRLVSMARPRLVALSLRIVPENWSGTIEIRSSLDGRVANANVAAGDGFDPRALEVAGLSAEAPGILLIETRTRRSRVGIATGIRTAVVPLVPEDEAPSDIRQGENSLAEHFERPAREGEAILVEKIAAIFTSQDPAIPEPMEASLQALREAPGFDELLDEHVRAWELLRAQFLLEVEAPELSRPLALNAFHLLQTVSPHSSGLDAGLPSRGWQEAYHGQVFWDETLSFPLLNLRFPSIARALLLYRYRRLGEARAAARARGLDGALFPWRSAITGREVTPAFQKNGLTGQWTRDHTHLQHHVGSAVAWNTWHYFVATGDVEFLTDHGAEIMIEVARFWASIARHDPGTGRYTIAGVMGPDEYHTGYPGAAEPGLVDNAYTNVMAVWTLARAQEVLDHLPARRGAELRHRLRIGSEEFARWDEVSRGLRLVFHGDGILSQFDGFDRLRPLDIDEFMRDRPDQRIDWLLAEEGEDINDFQVLKQADLAMLLHLLPVDELTAITGRMGYDLDRDRLRRSIDHYFRRTAHDSSLSDLVYAGALAQLDAEESWRIYRGALCPDEESGHSGTDEGIHLGAMAATLDILQRRYLGIVPGADAIAIDPAPPAGLGRVRMELLYHSGVFAITLGDGRLVASADPANPAPVDIRHRGRTEPLRPGGKLEFEL